MTHPVLSPEPVVRMAEAEGGRIWLLLPVGLALAAAAAVAGDWRVRLILLAAGGAVCALALLMGGVVAWDRRMARLRHAHVAAFVELDAAPSFTTDAEGEVREMNRAALARFGSRRGQSLAGTLGDLFATPASVLYRLQTKAVTLGAAYEDLVTRRGHARLAVHRVGKHFLWRLEEMAERPQGGRGAEGMSLPMMVASRSGTVLFMNEALRRLLGGRVKSLDRIFPHLPIRSGEEAEVSSASGPLRALVYEVQGSGGRREVYLLPGAALPAIAAREEGIAFEELPVALIRLGEDGALLAANRVARDLLGLSSGAGAMLHDLVEGPGRPVADWIADAVAGRGLNRPEVLRAELPDRELFLQITLRRVTEDGRSGIIAVLTDATEHKSLEAQFVQSQKMQAIGQLAGGVAHDFNNLLTAITGHCDLLLLHHDKSDPDYADLVQINENANRAAALVRQLLAFSRKQTLQSEVLDLRDTLSDLTHLLNRLVGEKVRLTFLHDDSLRPIRADRRQLEQVLMNLVVNARDAMPAGGEIRIETETRHLREEMHRDRAVVPPGDYAIVRVRDEGTGIPPDRLEKVFEPFFTTKRTGEGTGLGLSTAYGIVKQSGGYIFVDSQIDIGTTFTLYFPVHVPRADEILIAPVPLPAPVPTRAGEGVILLVEDEAPVRAFASRALKLRGYTVIEAENAEDALDLLADPGLAIDVFVTDVIMPGMDGPSWVREALRDRPGVRVVFVSGYAEDTFSETQSRIPNSVFLPKPFSLSELTATVQGQMH